MTNLINIQYGSKVCQLPKPLVINEEFMKEIVSANVWNNKLKKSDKMNLLKYLPSFPHNDTHEKKETLKKLFLGKPINFENQIKKFVRCAKEGQFTPVVKSQKVLDVILTERKARLSLLKRRINDLEKIVNSKKTLGMEISAEETRCLAEFAHVLRSDDPMAETIEARFATIMERVSADPDEAKKTALYRDYDNHVATGHTSFRSLTLDEVVNRCQNDVNDSGPEEAATATTVGPMTRKRRQLQNGFETGLSKYAKMKWDREMSSESQSDSSMEAKSVNQDKDQGHPHNEEDNNNNENNSDESGTSDTDSVTSTGNNLRRIRHSRHERREFRCPQEDFGDFFCLLQRLFLGAHQQRLTSNQVEERVRHWQTVTQRQMSDEYNGWAINGGSGPAVSPDWSCLVVPALAFLARPPMPLVERRRPKSQWWQWRGGHASSASLSEWYREWRRLSSLVQDDSGTHIHGQTDSNIVIGPSLYPTEWRVSPSTIEERLLFQAQERRRFSRPYRAFIYSVHGYCCAVSPIRGCLPGRDYSGVRARGHALLVHDRPPHVTIVEIVRDAVARLPNGEGSRADIVTLAMDSAYWTEPATNERTIGQCISSALDRLQGEGCDPSVKYNARLKLWFYRHRAKTVAELEEMHARNCREEMRRGRCESGASASTATTTMRPMTMAGGGYVYHQGGPHTLHHGGPHTLHQGGPHTLHQGGPRPSYQQFSRAVTSARDNNILMQPFSSVQRHAMVQHTGTTATTSSMIGGSSGQSHYYQQATNPSHSHYTHTHQPHFYY